jgi:hypothetical protein
MISTKVMIGGRVYGPAPLTVGRDIYTMAVLTPLNLDEILKQKDLTDTEKRQAIFMKLATGNKACEVLAGLLEEIKDGDAREPFSPEWAAETATFWGGLTNAKDHELLKLLVLQVLFAFFGFALAHSSSFGEFFANWAETKRQANDVSSESLQYAAAVIAEIGK